MKEEGGSGEGGGLERTGRSEMDVCCDGKVNFERPEPSRVANRYSSGDRGVVFCLPGSRP